MILVRDIFNLEFGKAREALELWKDGSKLMKQSGHNPGRLLTDLSGEYYTMVLESTFNNLAEFEQGHTQVAQTKEWRDWYQKFSPLVRNGRREIFNVVQ